MVNAQMVKHHAMPVDIINAASKARAASQESAVSAPPNTPKSEDALLERSRLPASFQNGPSCSHEWVSITF